MGEAADPAVIALLGPRGVEALGRARRALVGAGSQEDGAVLRIAAWTAPEWSFRFDLPEAGRTLVVSVPHDGGAPTVLDPGQSPHPFMPGWR